MRNLGVAGAAVGCALLCAGAAMAKPEPVIEPIEKADPYVAVPNAGFLADNRQVYRVVFESRAGPDRPDQLTPVVNMAGTELNTFAAHKVLRRNVDLVMVFHSTKADDAVLDDAHYRARHGVDNPNLPVLRALKRQGVRIYVCGQALLADGVPLEGVAPEVTIAEDGVVVLMTYGSQGYAHLTF